VKPELKWLADSLLGSDALGQIKAMDALDPRRHDEERLVTSVAKNTAMYLARGVLELLVEVEFERTHPFERLKAMGFEVDETGLAKHRAYEQEIVHLETRQQELLEAMRRITNETPFPDEANQVPVLIAKVGSLRAQLREACDIADRWIGRDGPMDEVTDYKADFACIAAIRKDAQS
jgi:hypothetical protein